MIVSELVKKYGKKLIGRQVLTEPMGDYPGGIAIVTKLHFDENAPELPMLVENPDWGEIGLFEYENIALLRN